MPCCHPYGVRAMWSERSRRQAAWDRPRVPWDGCWPRRAFPGTAHSSRDPPISDGTRAWVADSFVEGQPLSDRRKVARRRALTMDLTGVPSASPPRRGAPPSSPRIAATCPRACSTSATTRTTKSEPLPRPSRCAEGVCLCLGCRSECEMAKVCARRAGMHICLCVHEQCS